MREIRQAGKYSYVYSRYLEPIATVKPGETVVIYTEDAYESRVVKETDITTKDLGKYFNPQTGPIFVEGAEPGDTLAIHILDIEVTRDWAVSAMTSNFGGLSSTRLTKTLNEPLPQKVWIYKREGNQFVNSDHLKFAISPFMGTMATAPDLEMISSITPFDQGGNMDVFDVRTGNILYLPVRVPGACFFTGDCHANQGDGELCGNALEVTSKLKLEFNLIKGKAPTWPRIESPTEYMAVGSARPMEDAARIAYGELIEWLVEMGWEKFEAYQLLTQCGKLYVGNMVSTTYSLVAKIEKSKADFFKHGNL